jgi:hypothetical protein
MQLERARLEALASKSRSARKREGKRISCHRRGDKTRTHRKESPPGRGRTWDARSQARCGD